MVVVCPYAANANTVFSLCQDPKVVMKPLGVRNVVTTLEREVVLRRD